MIAALRDRIPAICARYGRPAPVEVRRLTGGTANINFVARFVDAPPIKITFCLVRDLAGARRVAGLLKALDDAPIGRLLGEPGDVLAEAGRPALVTRFTDGAPLDAVDRPTAAAIGRLLAAMHRRPPPATPPR